MSNNQIERIFQIVAVILAGIAAYFYWRGNSDGAFVSVVLGAVSFFLSIRFQVKESIRQREAEENDERYELEEHREPAEDFDDPIIESEREKVES